MSIGRTAAKPTLGSGGTEYFTIGALPGGLGAGAVVGADLVTGGGVSCGVV